MLQKARQPKHGENKSMLERWHKDEQYRKSLSEIGWTEEQIFEYDNIALEDHASQQDLKELKLQNIGYSD